MKSLTIAIAAVAMLAFPAVASAAACRDTHGHFMKCPAPVLRAPVVHASHAAAAHATFVKPMRRAPCRDAKGRFKRC
jgi:hypothetical protein